MKTGNLSRRLCLMLVTTHNVKFRVRPRLSARRAFPQLISSSSCAAKTPPELRAADSTEHNAAGDGDSRRTNPVKDYRRTPSSRHLQHFLSETAASSHTHTQRHTKGSQLASLCPFLPSQFLAFVFLGLLLHRRPHKMTHDFYYGLHPVSWFILFANVAIALIEWQFLVSQFIKVSKAPEKESKATGSDAPA